MPPLQGHDVLAVALGADAPALRRRPDGSGESARSTMWDERPVDVDAIDALANELFSVAIERVKWLPEHLDFRRPGAGLADGDLSPQRGDESRCWPSRGLRPEYPRPERGLPVARCTSPRVVSLRLDPPAVRGARVTFVDVRTFGPTGVRAFRRAAPRLHGVVCAAGGPSDLIQIIGRTIRSLLWEATSLRP